MFDDEDTRFLRCVMTAMRALVTSKWTSENVNQAKNLWREGSMETGRFNSHHMHT